MRHFVAVAEELHFGRAARRLNMAQPPLSQSIKRLEEDLGINLFNRSRHGVELTPAGAVFLTGARRTLAQAELARTMARRTVNDLDWLTVTFAWGARTNFLPPVLAEFHDKHPDTRLRLFEIASREQVARVLRGEFDVAFVLGQMQSSGELERMIVERSPFMAAVPSAWPLAERDSVTLTELADHPFVMPPKQYLRYLPDTMEIFETAGIKLDVVQEATQPSVILSLVAAGIGCSVIKATTQGYLPRGVKMLPISDHPPDRRWELVMTWHTEHMTPASAAFVEIVKGHVAAHPQLLDPQVEGIHA